MTPKRRKKALKELNLLKRDDEPVDEEEEKKRLAFLGRVNRDMDFPISTI